MLLSQAINCLVSTGADITDLLNRRQTFFINK